MHRSPRLLALFAIVAAASCGDADDRSPAADTAATPAPPVASASPASWRVSEMGYGPLHAGMTVAEAASVVPGTFTSPSGDTASACEYAQWSEAPSGVHVMLVSGVVARVDVDSMPVQTEAGAGIGSSEARIDSLYPGRVRRMPHKYVPGGSYLVVLAPAASDTMNRIVFETDSAHVTSFRAGRFPPVEYVEGCS